MAAWNQRSKLASPWRLSGPTLEGLARTIERSFEVRGLEQRLRRQGRWDDLGKLKLELLDVLTAERNDFAKRVMETVER